MNRSEALALVSGALGDRRLVWFGTRGEDAESVTELKQFEASFSIIGRYGRRASVRSASLEERTKVRVDLDTFELDDHLESEPVRELREGLLRVLAGRSAVFTYRPSTFLSAVGFARQDRCRALGMFKAHQFAFEHKPWLETIIADLDLPRVVWNYVPDIDLLDVERRFERGPIMLRKSRTNGGVGLVRVDRAEQLEDLWPRDDEAFVSVADFVTDAVPVNVSAVVWPDGITVHPASVQLIGIPEATTRPFGYCGNDFGAVAALGGDVLDRIEERTMQIGDRLRTFGYRGAFGVDFLVRDGEPLFTEVNPRFQGSTSPSCRIAVAQEQSCLLLDHLAAFLDIPAPTPRPLRRWAEDLGEFAHVVVHNTLGRAERMDVGPLVNAAVATPGFVAADVLTTPAFVTEPCATVVRFTTATRVTSDGYTLGGPIATVLDDVPQASLVAPDPSSPVV